MHWLRMAEFLPVVIQTDLLQVLQILLDVSPLEGVPGGGGKGPPR